MAIDGLIIEYFVYVILAINFYYTIGYSNSDLLNASIASLFILVAKVCTAIAIAEGLAAPA